MGSAIKINLSGDTNVGDFIAALALILSGVALARPWWAGRKADIEVRSEEYRRIRGDRADSGARFVLKNHGPAQARDVEVNFFHDGQPVNLILTGWARDTTTPLLHPGKEFHLNYVVNFGGNIPELVVVTWRGGRRRRQGQEFYPSVREL